MGSAAFSRALTEIFRYTDITVSNLAAEIGYDASYISRWKNGKSLPTMKNGTGLISKISAYVAENSSKAAMESIFYALNESIPADEDKYADALYLLLLQALQKGTGEAASFSKGEKPERMHTETLFPMRRFSADLIKELLERYSPDDSKNGRLVHVYIDLSSELFRFLNHELNAAFWRKLQSFLPDTTEFSFYLRTGDCADSYNRMETCRQLLNYMESWGNCNYSINQIQGGSCSNTILIGNNLCLMFLPQIDSLLVVSEKNDIERIASRLAVERSANGHYTSAVISITQEEYRKNRFDMSYNLNRNKTFLLSKMYPVYMSESTLTSLADICGIDHDDYWINFQRKGFDYPKAAIIYRSALSDYAYNGHMVVNYTLADIPVELRRRHLKDIIDKLESDEHWSMYIFDDYNSLLPSRDFSLSLFINERTVYAIDRSIHAEETRILQVTSNNAVSLINKALETESEKSMILKYCLSRSETISVLRELLHAIS